MNDNINVVLLMNDNYIWIDLNLNKFYNLPYFLINGTVYV